MLIIRHDHRGPHLDSPVPPSWPLSIPSTVDYFAAPRFKHKAKRLSKKIQMHVLIFPTYQRILLFGDSRYDLCAGRPEERAATTAPDGPSAERAMDGNS